LQACWVAKDGSVSFELGRRLELPSREFLGSGRCRRILVDVEMDGRIDRRQCERGEEKCDYCEQHLRGIKRTVGELEQS
jgi:hypothetical protein